MAKKNRGSAFSEIDEWGDYKRPNKKKAKHREDNQNWRFDKRVDYKVDDYDEDESNHKTGDW